jgi:hypothetical protein
MFPTPSQFAVTVWVAHKTFRTERHVVVDADTRSLSLSTVGSGVSDLPTKSVRHARSLDGVTVRLPPDSDGLRTYIAVGVYLDMRLVSVPRLPFVRPQAT